ncbi:hypothetical protein AFLA_004881 [Aspergillus flavus NRRL3357]|nr:hypothetical protein AFLA_004881 [Aspergillus flavus NRRL3357]
MEHGSESRTGLQYRIATVTCFLFLKPQETCQNKTAIGITNKHRGHDSSSRLTHSPECHLRSRDPLQIRLYRPVSVWPPAYPRNVGSAG